MAKIKNWRREDKTEANTGISWMNNKTKSRVIITNLRNGPYAVELLTKSSDKGRKFDTKEEAKRWAVSWMRKHPNS